MKFRVAYFTPDPFRGDRFAIGALLDDGATVRFERSAQLPDSACLGGPLAVVALRMSLETISTIVDLHKIEIGTASQLISFGDLASVPDGVSSPRDWVRTLFLSRAGDESAQRRRPQSERRDTVGLRFFERWDVAKFVKRRFHFSSPAGAARLPIVKHHPTHWVEGKNSLLLMEPVVGTKPSFNDDLKVIAESMLAHRKLFEMASSPVQPELITYVFSNGYRGALSDVKRALKDVSEVINVENSAARSQFVERVRDVGQSVGFEWMA